MPPIGYIEGLGASRYYVSPDATPTGDEFAAWVVYRSRGFRSFTPRVLFGCLNTGATSPTEGWGFVLTGDTLFFRFVDSGGNVRSMQWFEPTRVHGHWVAAIARINASTADLSASLCIASCGQPGEVFVAGLGGALTYGAARVTVGGAWTGAALVHPANADVHAAGYGVGLGVANAVDVENWVDGLVYDPESTTAPNAAGGVGVLDLIVPAALTGPTAPGATWGGTSGTETALNVGPGSPAALSLLSRSAPRWL